MESITLIVHPVRFPVQRFWRYMDWGGSKSYQELGGGLDMAEVGESAL